MSRWTYVCTTCFHKDTENLHGLVASNLVLKIVGANRWIPFLACMWGAVTILTGLVTNFSGLIATRIFLGGFEGGILPGLVSDVFAQQQVDADSV